jgi:hypothetical protein
MIDRSLNGIATGADGRRYIVSYQSGAGFPPIDNLANELWRQQPVLLVYRSSTFSSHAVVLTGMVYTETNGRKIVQSLYIRDPFPTPDNVSNLGRVEILDTQRFMSSVGKYWFVRVAPFTGR